MPITSVAAQNMSLPTLLFWLRGMRNRWWRPIIGAGVIWLSVRLALITLAVTVRSSQPNAAAFFSHPNWLFTLFFHWDSNYFAGIAGSGYFGHESLQRWQAFFPGYPLIARALASLVWGWSPAMPEVVVALSVTSAAASAVASMLLWRMAEDEFGITVARGATVLFFAGPYALFLVASYSEALFLVFAIGAWMGASRGRWLSAGVLSACASFTRINGLFLIAALVVLLVTALAKRGIPFVWRTIGLVSIGLSGIGIYFAYLSAATGNLFAWSDAENAGWHRSLDWPWITLYDTLDSALHAHPAARLQSWLEIIVAVLLIVATVVMVRRRRWPEATLIGLSALAMMTSYSYMSLARNSLLLFPLVILTATTLTVPKWKWVYWTVLAAGGAVLLVNVRQLALGLWAD
jgi:hypothetical protein